MNEQLTHWIINCNVQRDQGVKKEKDSSVQSPNFQEHKSITEQAMGSEQRQITRFQGDSVIWKGSLQLNRHHSHCIRLCNLEAFSTPLTVMPRWLVDSWPSAFNITSRMPLFDKTLVYQAMRSLPHLVFTWEATISQSHGNQKYLYDQVISTIISRKICIPVLFPSNAQGLLFMILFPLQIIAPQTFGHTRFMSVMINSSVIETYRMNRSQEISDCEDIIRLLLSAQSHRDSFHRCNLSRNALLHSSSSMLELKHMFSCKSQYRIYQRIQFKFMGFLSNHKLTTEMKQKFIRYLSYKDKEIRQKWLEYDVGLKSILLDFVKFSKQCDEFISKSAEMYSFIPVVQNVTNQVEKKLNAREYNLSESDVIQCVENIKKYEIFQLILSLNETYSGSDNIRSYLEYLKEFEVSLLKSKYNFLASSQQCLDVSAGKMESNSSDQSMKKRIHSKSMIEECDNQDSKRKRTISPCKEKPMRQLTILECFNRNVKGSNH